MKLQKLKRLFNLFFGPVLLLFVIYSVYLQISKQSDLPLRWQQIKSSIYNPLLWLSFFLMLINYSIEAFKWKRLASKVQQISFLTALKSVLAGCSITLITPNRTGEYGGRILYLNEGNRLRGVALTIAGSISQLMVTLIMGTIGLFFLRYNENFNFTVGLFYSKLIFWLSFSVSCIAILFYFRLPTVTSFLEKIIPWPQVKYLIKILQDFTFNELAYVFGLSLIRYIIFVLQYIILYKVMQVDISLWWCFWLVSFFYLIMAIIPTLGLFELPVRMQTSAQLFSVFSNNAIGIQATQLTILFFNLLIPALLGSILVLRIKRIFKEN